MEDVCSWPAAHKAASVADTASSRPQLTAFAAWVLRRFGATHGAEPALYGTGAFGSTSASDFSSGRVTDPDAGSGLTEPAMSAKAAFAEPAASAACDRVRALAEPLLLTIVLRTAKRNGNVSAQLPFPLRIVFVDVIRRRDVRVVGVFQLVPDDGMLSQGRRLTGVEHLVHAAEACGFAVAQLDMAALPLAQQLQVRPTSSLEAQDLSVTVPSKGCHASGVVDDRT